MSRLKVLNKLAAGFLSLSIILGSQAAQAAKSEEVAPTAQKIVINSASRIMSLYEGDKKVAIYPLGLGKVNTPTPTGYYKIRTKEKNPPWIDPSHPEYEVPSGPNNPLGYRWMQIHGNYGIHGTNRPDSIGHYVSNGCIRMLEKNVEELFDRVSVGTPVEITYNRVVVEKVADGNIVYYIYPDGYRWQKLNVESVNKWLEPYGIAPFESDEEIAKKIKTSDGQPTYLGKPYNIEINDTKVEDTEANGKKFVAKAVTRDKITYLPAVPIAMTLKTKLEWRAEESTLKTALGEVTGYEFKKQIYLNADDAVILFGVDGGVENGVFKLRTIETQPTEPEKPEVIEPDKPVEAEKPVEVDKPTDTTKIEKTAEENLEVETMLEPEKIVEVEKVEEDTNAKVDDN